MIKKTIFEEYNSAKRELLELKTAQLKPSIMKLFDYTFSVSSVGSSNGARLYRIHFVQDESNEPPLIWSFRFSGSTGSGLHLASYDPIAQTQDIRVDNSGSISVTLISTREIASVSYEGQNPNPVYPPAIEWTQVRDFYPQDMGTTPGWCLQNCRLGFHIYSGTFQNAVSDMQSQRNNGTLHPFDGATETPPDYIACPVYINIRGVSDGHVCVWDHGTIWNDGYTVPRFTDMGGYIEVWGWGELCDGQRVVQHV